MTRGFLIFLAAALAALVVQLNPAWRDMLIYERQAIESGQLWRLWTGHWVHFGWAHFIADSALFLFVGWWTERRHPRFGCFALILMPPFISAALYWFDPEMIRYAGLSAVNLGLLLYLAVQGWQRHWTDWFWPAVVVVYVGEVIFEAMKSGHGGGMIPFDDPSVKVATSAHLAGAVYALLAWGIANWGLYRRKRH